MLRETEQSDAPQLEEIATFLRVAEAGSLTAAAQLLGLPKSTVSRRLGRLEEKLGARLLHRTTRRLTLTDVGAAYRERVTAAMAHLEEASEAVRARSEAPRGHLRITAPFDLGPPYLAEVCAEFARQHRQSTVEVVLTERKLDLVAEGIDLALRATPAMPDSTLVARRIVDTETQLFASPEYLCERGTPRSVEELAGHDMVLRSAPHGRGTLRLVGPEGEVREVAARAAVSCNEFSFVRQVTLAHTGIGCMPMAGAVAEDVRAGRLVRVLPGWIAGSASLYIVQPGARLLSANVRVFRELLLERLSAGFLTDAGATPGDVTAARSTATPSPRPRPDPARGPRRRAGSGGPGRARSK